MFDCVMVLMDGLLIRQDPAVTQHSSTTGYATLDLYNPFENTMAVSTLREGEDSISAVNIR